MQVNLDKWHHCNVDKQEFKLLQKSDYKDLNICLFFLALWFFLDICMLLGGLGGLFYSYLFKNIWNCADPIWHETGRKTAFKSNFWNNFLSDRKLYEWL